MALKVVTMAELRLEVLLEAEPTRSIACETCRRYGISRRIRLASWACSLLRAWSCLGPFLKTPPVNLTIGFHRLGVLVEFEVVILLQVGMKLS